MEKAVEDLSVTALRNLLIEKVKKFHCGSVLYFYRGITVDEISPEKDILSDAQKEKQKNLYPGEKIPQTLREIIPYPNKMIKI